VGGDSVRLAEHSRNETTGEKLVLDDDQLTDSPRETVLNATPSTLSSVQQSVMPRRPPSRRIGRRSGNYVTNQEFCHL